MESSLSLELQDLFIGNFDELNLYEDLSAGSNFSELSGMRTCIQGRASRGIVNSEDTIISDISCYSL